jgi:hypothetical protein
MEYEPQPEKQICWQSDAESYYLKIRTEVGVYELRPTDTLIFRFDDENRDLDHIFRVTGEDENCLRGFRMYRYQLEEKGFNFDQFCLEMRQREFEEVYEAEPNQEEIEAYMKAGNKYPIIKKTEPIEIDPLEHFEEEFNFYLGDDNGEWRIK